MSNNAQATGASAEAIQHHYDLSNEFYSLWLDSGMIYSSALWHSDEGLEQAQVNKLRWHLEQANIHNAERLLDIGCGWGSLMKEALQSFNVKNAFGLTLSKAQLHYIQESSIENINAKLESWADHKVDAGYYDGIVSIGAFEHFARLDQSIPEKIAGYKRFFDFCKHSLKQGGMLSLQTITYQDTDREDFSDFFAEEIFPQSDLPYLSEILEAIKGRFELVTMRNDRHHYADTLRHWLKNLKANKDKAIALVGEEKFHTYEKYLAMMIIAFHTGSMNLARLSLKKIG